MKEDLNKVLNLPRLWGWPAETKWNKTNSAIHHVNGKAIEFSFLHFIIFLLHLKNPILNFNLILGIIVL